MFHPYSTRISDSVLYKSLIDCQHFHLINGRPIKESSGGNGNRIVILGVD